MHGQILLGGLAVGTEAEKEAMVQGKSAFLSSLRGSSSTPVYQLHEVDHTLLHDGGIQSSSVLLKNDPTHSSICEERLTSGLFVVPCGGCVQAINTS